MRIYLRGKVMLNKIYPEQAKASIEKIIHKLRFLLNKT